MIEKKIFIIILCHYYYANSDYIIILYSILMLELIVTVNVRRRYVHANIQRDYGESTKTVLITESIDKLQQSIGRS